MIRLPAVLLILFSIIPHLHAASVLVVRKGAPQFQQVFEQMKKEIGTKYNVIDFVIDKNTAYEPFLEKVKEVGPTAAVLMDNQSISFGLKYNSEQKDEKNKIKGIGMLGLNLKTYLKGNKDFAGVAYETPAYTMLTQFRHLVTKPIKNVLVFYRKSLFDEAITQARTQLKAESIELTAVDVESKGASREEVDKFMKENFKKHVESTKVDAVWVVLDSFLLTQDLFSEVWLPVARTAKVPFLAGVENLVSKEFNFCTFAIIPNLSDLASQATQMLDSIVLDNVAPKDIGVEELIGVNKILNMQKIKELKISLKSDDLSEIKVIQ